MFASIIADKAPLKLNPSVTEVNKSLPEAKDSLIL